MPRTRIYVGLMLDCTTRREVFRANATPTLASHGARYGAVVGPFRTMRAADAIRIVAQWRTRSGSRAV